jgi:hypothetical protein
MSTETLPFEYDSKEQAIQDFETAVNNHSFCCDEEFVFAGHTFYTFDFIDEDILDLPEILTLEEWYNRYS